MINIIGGTKKRTKLYVPLTNVRPTSSQKRGSIFSILESYASKNNINIYTKKNFLDLFSGTGAFGLEALSRGANYCYFYENNKHVESMLIKNCQKISHNQYFKIIKKNIVNNHFKDIDKKIATVFIDPPYSFKSFKEILQKLSLTKKLINNSIIIIETSKDTIINFPVGYEKFDERVYRKTKIVFLLYKELT